MIEISASVQEEAPSIQPAKPAGSGVLRGASTVACWLAISTAFLVLFLRAYKLLGGATLPLPTFFKSAVPLIAIGVAYLALVLSARRTLAEKALGVCVSAAFIFWGGEQYLSNGAVVAALDDLVAFLFVLDLSIVIRRQLAQSK